MPKMPKMPKLPKKPPIVVFLLILVASTYEMVDFGTDVKSVSIYKKACDKCFEPKG